MSFVHLKDYPISTPKRPMTLNNFAAKHYQKPKLQDIAEPRSTESRQRSHSDLSESSNFSLGEAVSSTSSNTSATCSSPPSPSPSNQKDKLSTPSTPQDEYLLIIEPEPVLPPHYSTLPPGGCPRFPVILNEGSGLEELPDYSPSVYKLLPVMKKVEWINPYESSSTRSWKPFLMELNSTQLNFYSIPNNLECHMLNFLIMGDSRIHIDDYRNYPTDLDLAPTDDFYQLNSPLTNRFDYEFFNCCKRLHFTQKLARSYSLQHCKIGLAADYKKKNNVLRMRIESEQILIGFQHTKDLIDWNMALNIGKDLSLDLIDRELPRYRTVPRRRRRRGDGREPIVYNYESSNQRARSNSEPSNMMSRMSKLKLRLRRELSANLSSPSSMVNSRSNSVLSMSTLSSIPQSEITSVEPSSVEASGVEDNDDDLSEYNSDGEDEEDSEIYDGDANDPDILRLKIKSKPIKKADDKWIPRTEPQTVRKFYKTCMRCIKPLNADDSWVSKNLVKPTSYSVAAFGSLAGSKQTIQNMKKSEVNLGKVPGHHVKEFIVGTHGLVPRQLT